MIIISFSKQQSCEYGKKKKRYQSGTAKNCGIKTKYGTIVQHTMVILLQIVDGDC
jgi:hypothetical protein